METSELKPRSIRPEQSGSFMKASQMQNGTSTNVRKGNKLNRALLCIVFKARRKRTLTTAQQRNDSERPVLGKEILLKKRKLKNWSQDDEKIKLQRAQGGCPGTIRRRRTWQAAKSYGEPQAGTDP